MNLSTGGATTASYPQPSPPGGGEGEEHPASAVHGPNARQKGVRAMNGIARATWRSKRDLVARA
jgi:hypothetical protein